MNTNYDKQYKTEALVMLENHFFYGEKNKQYEGELFPDVCVNTRWENERRWATCICVNYSRQQEYFFC